MKLRYRLFCWIGGLFLLSFVSSYFLEHYLTDKYLEEAHQQLIQKVRSSGKETQENDDFTLSLLKEESKKVINRISITMRLIAIAFLVVFFIILHLISKKITRPISLLARATKAVREGKWDEIHFPPISQSKKDEIAVLYHSFKEMVEGLKDREKVQGVLNKVVSPEIAHEILKGTIHLGGEEKVVTVLFADIRHFTQMTENMLPHEVIDLLNTCMTKMARVIDKFGGVIDKYVGDEIMALFGTPISKDDSALKAVLAAIEMVDVLKAWNEERKEKGLCSVEMGIGIHKGLVVAGNMGSENRLNYTVLGSNVNLAARLCSAAAGMQILVSQDVLDAPFVKDKFEVEKLATMTLKGFDTPVQTFSIKKMK